MTDAPANRLDRALWELEQTLSQRSLQALGRVRAAIEARRSAGGFLPTDEFAVCEELRRLENQGYRNIERYLDTLADQIKQTGGPP